MEIWGRNGFLGAFGSLGPDGELSSRCLVAFWGQTLCFLCHSSLFRHLDSGYSSSRRTNRGHKSLRAGRQGEGVNRHGESLLLGCGCACCVGVSSEGGMLKPARAWLLLGGLTWASHRAKR